MIKFTSEQIAEILAKEEAKITRVKNCKNLEKSILKLIKRAEDLGFTVRYQKGHPCGDLSIY